MKSRAGHYTVKVTERAVDGRVLEWRQTGRLTGLDQARIAAVRLKADMLAGN